MVSAGGSAGALLAAPTSDILGRKWSVFLWGFIFVIGAVMQMIANYETLLAGRFIGGLGVGATSMLSPQFLAGSPSLFYCSLAFDIWLTYNRKCTQICARLDDLHVQFADHHVPHAGFLHKLRRLSLANNQWQ
jgi:Sugar (and other) transporter